LREVIPRQSKLAMLPHISAAPARNVVAGKKKALLSIIHRKRGGHQNAPLKVILLVEPRYQKKRE